MDEFYGKKIQGGEINHKTGEAWKLEDVRAYWKPRVEKWLEAAGGSTE